jgi:hypothetical protein
MSRSESEEWWKLTVRQVKSLGLAWTVTITKSLGQAVDTNELEWDSRVGKINSKTRKDTNELEWESRVGNINSATSKIIMSGINSKTIEIIRSGSRYKSVRVRVKSGED